MILEKSLVFFLRNLAYERVVNKFCFCNCCKYFHFSSNGLALSTYTGRAVTFICPIYPSFSYSNIHLNKLRVCWRAWPDI